MTRVLFLTESFHPVLGGGETHIRRLGSRLADSGMPCTVLTRRGEPAWPAEERIDGLRVVRVGPPGPGRSGKYFMVPGALAALAREGRGHDVVVVRGTRVLGLPGLLAARAMGRAVVMQPEVNGEMSGEVYTWGQSWEGGPLAPAVRAGTALRNLLLRDADAFVAMSTRIRTELLDAGVPAERVALIPHGVDTECFRPASSAERTALRSRLRLGDGILAAWTGRLLRGKGLEVLLEAFAGVAGAEPALRLVLVGSGKGQALSVEEGLRRDVERRGLRGRVVFTGRVERVEDYLRACDLFVFPSVFEALGISLVEAVACGLPSVGSRTGGIVDVIEDGVSGLLVPPREAGELGRALVALARDPARRAAMGRRARAAALSRFDERDSVERYRALFREVSSPRSGASRPGGAARGGGNPPP